MQDSTYSMYSMSLGKASLKYLIYSYFKKGCPPKTSILKLYSAQEMLDNLYLQPKTPEFYIATMPEHNIHTDNV